ncbi:MAG: sigma 54-interacting transcriptional regulator [Thermacetogeniaceae bacterium]
MRYCRFRIRFPDRIGMTRDVADIVASHKANITALEAKPGEQYLQITSESKSVLETILEKIETISGMDEVIQVQWLPFELAQQQLRAVFDAVDVNILVTDKYGNVLMCNKKAIETYASMGSIIGDTPLGSALQQLGFPKEILKTIITSEINDQEILLNIPGRSGRYIAKNKLIMNDQGEISGSMVFLEEMARVRRLANFMTRPVMVTFKDIVHSGEKMGRIIDLAKTVAKGTSTILLRGESGTGKELFARAIHMASARKDKPYVVVNCAAIPDTLLESELFGYTAGTFTGGNKGGRQGLFEFANTGTIFLDEIGEIPPYIQAKLLRVLQDGYVRRLGEALETKVDVRLIAATNRNLEKMLASGEFREDLFYRINVISVVIPPLREHLEDIEALTLHFINKLSKRLGKNIASAPKAVIERFMAYDWPGNTRELENIIERAMNFAQGNELKPGDITLPVFTTDMPGKLKNAMADTEKQLLLKALREGKSIRKAATLLGVSHATVINKMKRYHIDSQTIDQW